MDRVRQEIGLTEIQIFFLQGVMNNFHETLKDIIRSCGEHMIGVILNKY
jgi:hypothetical protein